MDAQTALETLQRGNQNFVNDQLGFSEIDSGRKQELTAGQAPFAIILSCADSRVVPEYVFDQGLGQLFVVRVAGNIANKSSMASIEYAVAHLGTRLIIVLGHESCGAVTAAVAGGDNGPNLNHLLGHIGPVVEQSSGEVDEVIRLNAQSVAKDLIANSEILAGVADLKIAPAYYHLGTGEVEFL